MKKISIFISSLILLTSLSTEVVNAHGGRTDSKGCHTQKSTGSYHCHNSGSSSNNSSNNSSYNNNSSRTTPTRPYTPLTVSNLEACNISIKLGDQGEAVGQTQKYLAKLNHLPSNAPDGIFGSQTEAAVINYQKEKELTADGIVGCQTFSALVEDIEDLN